MNALRLIGGGIMGSSGGRKRLFGIGEICTQKRQTGSGTFRFDLTGILAGEPNNGIVLRTWAVELYDRHLITF